MEIGEVQVKTWGEFTPDDVFEMAVLRSEVFFLEQKITEEEFDSYDRDPHTIHLFVRDEHGMAGYLRILHATQLAAEHEGIPDSLGRMVVRKDRRGEGIAQRLMSRAIELVGDRPLYLHAQTYVTSLYASFGFVEHGAPFDEAGIAHVMMIRRPGANS